MACYTPLRLVIDEEVPSGCFWGEGMTQLPWSIPYINVYAEQVRGEGILKAPTRKVQLRRVLVTGASGGVGFEICRELLKDENTFVYLACRSGQKGQEVALEVGFPTERFAVLELDLASPDSISDTALKLQENH